MEISDLKYILAIDKASTFTEAAYEVALSQSSLSKHVKKVEDELGIQIFDRSTRRINITPVGAEFMIHARRVVAEFDALHAAMRQYTSSFSGNIVVGTMPIMARQGLAACIANFNRKHPKVRIEISEGKTKELVKRLHYGEIDVAFVVLDKIEDRTITLHPLIQDELILVVDELNPLAKKRSIDLAEAANENFIFPTQRSSMFELGMRACEASGFTPKIAYQCGEIDMINHLVAERLGVSIMARKVALASALPNTVILSLKTKIERVTSLAVSSAEAPSSTVRLFIDHVLQEKF